MATSSTASLYSSFLAHAFTGLIDLAGATIKLALLKSTYAAAGLTTDNWWSTISADEIAGTGYTAGGKALTGTSVVHTLAGTWALSRASTTVYGYGAIIRPATANGYLYRCVVGGTSGAAVPTFSPVVGVTVADGTVTWACVGTTATVFTSASAQWTTATFSASYGVIYAVGSAADTSPLIALQSFAAAEVVSDEVFEIAPAPDLGWFAFSQAG